jgi:hypothetical protein
MRLLIRLQFTEVYIAALLLSGQPGRCKLALIYRKVLAVSYPLESTIKACCLREYTLVTCKVSKSYAAHPLITHWGLRA